MVANLWKHVLTFQQSSNPLIREVYKKLMEPVRRQMARSTLEGLRRICEGERMAFAAVEVGVDSLRGQTGCEVLHLPATAVPATIAMAVAKGSPYKRILSH
jgi:hypothetical protein